MMTVVSSQGAVDLEEMEEDEEMTSETSGFIPYYPKTRPGHPRRTRRSTHSSLIDRTNRSAYALQSGAWYGVCPGVLGGCDAVLTPKQISLRNVIVADIAPISEWLDHTFVKEIVGTVDATSGRESSGH